MHIIEEQSGQKVPKTPMNGHLCEPLSLVPLAYKLFIDLCKRVEECFKHAFVLFNVLMIYFFKVHVDHLD